MKSYFKMYGWAMYMGVATSILGIKTWHWEFYFLAVPLSILIHLQNIEVIRRYKEES